MAKVTVWEAWNGIFVSISLLLLALLAEKVTYLNMVYIKNLRETGKWRKREACLQKLTSIWKSCP